MAGFGNGQAGRLVNAVTGRRDIRCANERGCGSVNGRPDERSLNKWAPQVCTHWQIVAGLCARDCQGVVQAGARFGRRLGSSGRDNRMPLSNRHFGGNTER